MENYNANEDDPIGANASHIFRYYMARGYIEGCDVVLDVAAGWGYGSAILSRSLADQVIAIEKNDDCVKHIEDNRLADEIIHKNLNDMDELPNCDLAVSIETIEHLNDPEKFASMLKESTKRHIVVSTPIIKTTETNKDHLHNFTPETLQKLFVDEDWGPIHWANQGNVYGLFSFYRK